LFLAVVGLALASGLGYAEKEKTEKKVKTVGEAGGWGFFGPYVGMFDFDRLNATLAASPDPYGKLNANHFMFGGGGLALFSGMTIGGYGYGGTQTTTNTTNRLAVDYAGGAFEMGWLPVSTPHFKIGPALGIGGSGFSIRSSPASGAFIGFDSLLAAGSKAWEISGGGFSLAPALNIYIPISFAGLSLKVGYTWVPMDKEWTLGDAHLKNGPELSSSGPFAALQVMLGGGESPRRAKVKAKIEAGTEDDEDEKEEKEEPEEEHPEPGK
jgi:hypothetical protein